MFILNKYEKECYLTDDEALKINDFFKDLVGEVEKITEIHIYPKMLIIKGFEERKD